MFGIVTNRFLGEVRSSFDALRFFPKSSKDMVYGEFVKKAMDTLNHTRGIADAVSCLNAFRFADGNFKKIKDAMDRKPEKWLLSHASEPIRIPLVSDGEARHSFFVTNAAGTQSHSPLCVSSASYADCFRPSLKVGEAYALSEGSPYCLKAPSKGSLELAICDRRSEKALATLSLTADLALAFTQNETAFEAVGCGSLTAFVRKGCPLFPNVPIPNNELLAWMEWDVLGRRSGLGVVKVSNHKFKDMDFLLTIGLAPLLLFDRLRRIGDMASSSILLSMANPYIPR